MFGVRAFAFDYFDVQGFCIVKVFLLKTCWEYIGSRW